MKKLLVILGPTATGKTDLALKLAKKFKGELVACDSRQVYQGLDIGTGKTPGKPENLRIRKSEGFWEIKGIKIWMYDLVKPTKQFNAFDWSRKALRIIEDINKRGKLPIIIGGTGLYLKALLEGLDSLVPPDPVLRVEMEKLSLTELQSRVAALSPAGWEKLNHSDKNNSRRMIRIIERISMYGYINKLKNSKPVIQNYDILKIGLNAPRPYLNSRIDQRVFDWFNRDILREVRVLIEGGVNPDRFKEFGLEYRLIADYLEGKISSKDELIKLIQTKIRQYAKRQMTWFKKEKDVNWFDLTDPRWKLKLERLVVNWYNQLR